MHLEVVRTAMTAGADVVALCDTNGGMLPDELSQMRPRCTRRIICAIWQFTATTTPAARLANSLAAVDAGVTHVQGTLNGYGERTGNADLVSIIANLELKKKQPVLPPRVHFAKPSASHMLWRK
jgi:2-isopropylmalate synthase